MTIQKYCPEGSADGFAEYSEADLERAMLSECIIEARAVKCDESCNLFVDLGCMQGVISREEAAYSPECDVKSIAVITRVGKSVCFKVLGFKTCANGQKYAVLSRRAAQREAYENYVSCLLAGDIIDAKITHIEPFGAFADIACGIISMIAVDNISVSRIPHPNVRFKVGDKIKAAVKSVDAGRITLTHKELLGTWEENAEEFKVGQTAAGKVRSIETYGIFVELTPNLAGLADFKEGVCVGQTACVYIKNILPKK